MRTFSTVVAQSTGLYEGGQRFETLEIWIAWAQQYALISLALGGTVGVGAWVWGAVGANPSRQSFGQMTLVLMCGSALALGLVPEIVNIFSNADL